MSEYNLDLLIATNKFNQSEIDDNSIDLKPTSNGVEAIELLTGVPKNGQKSGF